MFSSLSNPKFNTKLFDFEGLSLPLRVGDAIYSGILLSNKHNYKISNNIAAKVKTNSGIQRGINSASMKSLI